MLAARAEEEAEAEKEEKGGERGAGEASATSSQGEIELVNSSSVSVPERCKESTSNLERPERPERRSADATEDSSSRRDSDADGDSRNEGKDVEVEVDMDVYTTGSGAGVGATRGVSRLFSPFVSKRLLLFPRSFSLFVDLLLFDLQLSSLLSEAVTGLCSPGSDLEGNIGNTILLII